MNGNDYIPPTNNQLLWALDRMAARLSLRVRNRSKKGGFKRLPESIELPTDATVEDVKRAVAKEAKVSDFNRIGVHDPKTNSILKDRKALVRDLPNVVSAGEVLVKDLGKQSTTLDIVLKTSSANSWFSAPACRSPNWLADGLLH